MKKFKGAMIAAAVLLLFTGCGSASSQVQESPSSTKEEEQVEEPVQTDKEVEQIEEPAQTDKEELIPTETATIEPASSEVPESNLFSAGDFTLVLPAEWEGKYIVEEMQEEEFSTSYVAFYEKECNEEIEAGWLFTIGRFIDKTYEEHPSYEVVGEWNGITYVALFPTDVQCDGVSKKAQKQYFHLAESVEEVVTSIQQVTD